MYLSTYLPAYQLPTYLHTYLPTYLPTYQPTYLPHAEGITCYDVSPYCPDTLASFLTR